ncbi:hypothetical protein B0H10DRAFT_2436897, partial [Mycena sp. CBHHK59/15]
MPPSATFSNIPLSTSFEPALERSTVSLDWVLNSGLSTSDSLLSGRLCIPYRDTSDSLCSLRVHLHVSASLPFDLVLGRDWFHLCCTSFSTASFYLSSGVVDFSSLPNGALPFPPLFYSIIPIVPPAPQPSTAPAATEAIDTLPDCRPGSEASSSKTTIPSEPSTTSLNILRDILLGHHYTCSRISVFHADLPALKIALELHAIPHHNMSLIECRHALLHH